MGLVFDLAEAVNLLAGSALGLGTAPLAQRLEDAKLRKAMKKSFVRVVNELPAVTPSDKAGLRRLLSQSDFISAICGDDLAEDRLTALEDLASATLGQLDRPTVAIVSTRLRDAAFRVIESSVPLPDRVLHRSIRSLGDRVNELSALLQNKSGDTSIGGRQLRTIRSPFELRVNPQLPNLTAQTDSGISSHQEPAPEFASALALAIADVLDDFPVERIVAGSLDAHLLVDVYKAVDRLLQRFEEEIDTVLQLFLSAGLHEDYYGSAERITIISLARSNLRLFRIREQMQEIANKLSDLAQLDHSYRDRLQAIARICGHIVIAEDFLVLKLLYPGQSDLQFEDNRHAPKFWDSTGAETVDDLSCSLSKLFRYRSELHVRIATLMHSL